MQASMLNEARLASSFLLNKDHSVFQNTLNWLRLKFLDRREERISDITDHDDFMRLHAGTSTFYQELLPEIWNNYVPLYHSVWRQVLGKSIAQDNIHQDRTVYHFGRGGHKSRMFNLWIALEREMPSTARSDDLGLFVVEDAGQSNTNLYENIRAAGGHYIILRHNQLTENTRIAGTVIEFDAQSLERTTFAYQPGTVVMFNSHLLHGSNIRSIGSEQGAAGGFRTALTSVWLHKDDLRDDLLGAGDQIYEDLFLAGHDASMRAMIKEAFPDECRAEAEAFRKIGQLAASHRAGR